MFVRYVRASIAIALALATAPAAAGVELQAPHHTAPARTCLGTTLTLAGSGEPGHLYAIAVSGSQGPSPFLPGLPLDLGLDYLSNVVAIGVVDGGGATAKHPVFVPQDLPCGTTGYSQMVTLSLGPIGDAQKSPVVATEFVQCTVIPTLWSQPEFGSVNVQISGPPGETVDWAWRNAEGVLHPIACQCSTFATINSGTITIPPSGSIVRQWDVAFFAGFPICEEDWYLYFSGCASQIVLMGPGDACGSPR